jgi:hypothetical protein
MCGAADLAAVDASSDTAATRAPDTAQIHDRNTVGRRQCATA